MGDFIHKQPKKLKTKGKNAMSCTKDPDQWNKEMHVTWENMVSRYISNISRTLQNIHSTQKIRKRLEIVLTIT
jgi:hypothetical protein